MREQKYSNVLNEIENKKEEQKEKDLSLTREIKFSSLQKSLDGEGQIDLSPEERIAIAKKRLQEEREMELDKSNDFTDVLEQKKGQKNKEEELYITKKLKPVKLPRKIARFFLKLLFFFAFLFLLFLSAKYFLVPTIKEQFFLSPIDIFFHKIDTLIDELKNREDYNYQNIFKIDTEIKINSNIEALTELKDYQLKKVSYLSKDNTLFANEYSLTKDKETYSYTTYEKNNNFYDHFSTSENIYNLGKISETPLSLFLNRIYNFYYSDVSKKIMIKELELLKEELTEEEITSTKDELTFNDTTIQVKRNTFTLEAKKLANYLKKHEKVYLQDEVLNEFLNNLNPKEEDPTSHPIEDFLANLSENLESLSINIYTNNKNEFIGFDIEENGFRTIHYYTNREDKFSLYFNLNQKKEATEKESTNFALELLGDKQDKDTKIKINYNTKEMGTISLKDFSKEKISFTYELTWEDTKYSGDVLIYKDHENSNMDFSIRSSGLYLNLTTKTKYTQEENIKDFSQYKTTAYLEEIYQNEVNNFNSVLEANKVGTAFTNYYELLTLQKDFVKSLFTKKEEEQKEPEKAEENIALEESIE